MKNHEVIAGLRDKGYMVRVDHIRPFAGTKLPVRLDYDRPRLEPAAKGGKTIVRILKPRRILKREPKLVAIGEAECSHHDNYNKRLGLTIALGRALKILDS